MEEVANKNPSVGEQNLIVSKLLLLKYNLLHEYHIKQLEYFLVGCCNISLDGVIKISTDDHTVFYEVKTMRYYKKDGKKTVENHVLSLNRFLYAGKRYKNELQMAKDNLVKWTKELLWGEDTSVMVSVDGRQIN